MLRRIASLAVSAVRRLFETPPPERPTAEVRVPIQGGPGPRSGAITLEEPRDAKFSDLRSKWKPS